MKLSKENILKRGNESLAIGAIFSLSAISCPCPTCIGATAFCFLNSAREKLGISVSDLIGKTRK